MSAAEAAAQPPVVAFPASALTDQEQEAIYQRTRARCPLDDISLEELEAMLTIEDDEDMQYEEFLQVGPAIRTYSIEARA